MGRIKSTVLAAVAGVVLTAGALAAQGIPTDRSTFVTVSGPVSLPGVTLPAGTYLFRLADTLSTRNVVQIFDKDRTKIFATIIAVPAERMEPSGDAVITFKETPSDRPPALHYWYYAGEKSGQEFVYPKTQAMQIAAASGESVLATDASDMDAMKTAEISRVEPGAATQAQNAETSSAAQTAQQPAMPNEQASASTSSEQSQPTAQPESTTPQPAPTTTQSETTRPETQPSAESTPPSASANSRDAGTAPMTSQQPPRATGTSGRSELPRTASHEPLVALFGFLAMTAALGLHAFRKTAASRVRGR
jgi:hypothetical protein